jgi:uncharacterized membrane protein YphA (DoxX/SURF4 family)
MINCSLSCSAEFLRVLSIMRIVIGLLFLQHGGQKLFEFRGAAINLPISRGCR